MYSAVRLLRAPLAAGMSTVFPAMACSTFVKIPQLATLQKQNILLPKSFRRFKSDDATPTEDDPDTLEQEEESDDDGEADAAGSEDFWIDRRVKDPRDRTRKIPLELSIAYMESAGYKSTYGDKKIWELYRRNFPGRVHPNPRTRRKCIVFGRVSGGNPCPICRDEYLVVDYRNVKLISQFLTDYNRRIVTSETSGVCREQYTKLLVAIEKARDYGYLDVDAPFVEYDYEKYKSSSFS